MHEARVHHISLVHLLLHDVDAFLGQSAGTTVSPRPGALVARCLWRRPHLPFGQPPLWQALPGTMHCVMFQARLPLAPTAMALKIPLHGLR
jgi:hypothetical protein